MEYKVEDTELTSIANAIRNACNLSDELEFPTDFIAKIASLNSAYIGKDEGQYLYRKSPTSIGSNYNSEEDTLIGGTVAWNQLVANSGSVSVTVPSGHKYYSNIGGTKAIAISNGSAISATGGTDNIVDLTQMLGSTIADYIYSLEQTTSGSGIAWLKAHGFLTKNFYAYDSGSLQSVKTSEHRTVGFNQWDEEWEVGSINLSTGENATSTDKIRSKNYISILDGIDYYFKLPNGNAYVACYDGNKNYIGRVQKSGSSNMANKVFSVLSNSKYIRFFIESYGTTYNNDICINISKTTGSPKNGDYVAYDGHSYPLDSDFELRGIPKLDASNNLYYDGDVYESSGAVSRKYGIVDLGTLTWDKQNTSTGNYRFYSTSISGIKPSPSGTQTANILCSAYKTISPNVSWYHADGDGIAMSSSTSTILVVDMNYADATAFKTAMSGVYLVYELATPTTEQADPYASLQVVSPLGTEEYVDTRDVPIPVGHETMYYYRREVV